MKLFTKVALVSAMAVSANAMAMQALDDSTLSNTTGQDGITVTVAPTSDITISKVMIHDTDGLTGPSATQAYTGGYNWSGQTTTLGGSGKSGAIVINNLVLHQTSATTNPLLSLYIDTDGSADGTKPFLNIAAHVEPLSISTGKITVAASGTASAAKLLRGVGTTEATILNSLNLNVGSVDANIQLGNTPQGAMILLHAGMAAGLHLGNNARSFAGDGTNLISGTTEAISLHDNVGGGDIVIGHIGIADNGKASLTANLGVSVTTAGLQLKTTDPTGGYDIALDNVRLGAATNKAIGDVEIQGLTTGGSAITISGH